MTEKSSSEFATNGADAIRSALEYFEQPKKVGSWEYNETSKEKIITGLKDALSALSETAQKPADPSGDLMILRMALGNTAACLGDALATYNRFVGEEVFKNAAPQELPAAASKRATPLSAAEGMQAGDATPVTSVKQPAGAAPSNPRRKCDSCGQIMIDEQECSDPLCAFVPSATPFIQKLRKWADDWSKETGGMNEGDKGWMHAAREVRAMLDGCNAPAIMTHDPKVHVQAEQVLAEIALRDWLDDIAKLNVLPPTGDEGFRAGWKSGRGT